MCVRLETELVRSGRRFSGIRDDVFQILAVMASVASAARVRDVFEDRSECSTALKSKRPPALLDKMSQGSTLWLRQATRVSALRANDSTAARERLLPSSTANALERMGLDQFLQSMRPSPTSGVGLTDLSYSPGE